MAEQDVVRVGLSLMGFTDVSERYDGGLSDRTWCAEGGWIGFCEDKTGCGRESVVLG